MWKDKIKLVVDYIVKHGKIVFPVIVIAAVAATVSIALSAGSADKLEKQSAETEIGAETSGETVDADMLNISPMTLNSDPAITTLITSFYNAMALGDTETLKSVCDEISETDLLRYQEQSKYIEMYPFFEIYTKSGPEEGFDLVFVYYKVIFEAHEQEIPGGRLHYVCTNEQGERYIRRSEEFSEEVSDYIGQALCEDDVVEFYNRVTVEYNDLMVTYPELLEYMSEMQTQVNAAVGVAIAQENAEETQQAEETDSIDTEDALTDGGQDVQQPQENTVLYGTTTTTVNVRSSDSTQADSMGKVSGGTRLQIAEQKVNGWTKVLYEGKEGYIKSEYLEVTDGTVGADGTSVIGTITANANINIRASADESSEKVGFLIGGDSAELLANENGWCQIKRDGLVGYVKSEFVQVN